MAINLFAGLNTPQVTDPGTSLLRAQAAAEPVGRSFLGGLAIGQRREESQAELAERARGTNLLTGLRQQELGEQQRQFDVLAPVRAAQLVQANAQIQSLQATTALNAFTLKNKASQESGMAAAAALSETFRGEYTPENEAKFYNFMSRNPWMADSPWEKQMQGNFDASRGYQDDLRLLADRVQLERQADARVAAAQSEAGQARLQLKLDERERFDKFVTERSKEVGFPAAQQEAREQFIWPRLGAPLTTEAEQNAWIDQMGPEDEMKVVVYQQADPTTGAMKEVKEEMTRGRLRQVLNRRYGAAVKKGMSEADLAAEKARRRERGAVPPGVVQFGPADIGPAIRATGRGLNWLTPGRPF